MGLFSSVFLILKGMLITFRMIIYLCFPRVVIIKACLLVMFLLAREKSRRTSTSGKDIEGNDGRPVISSLQLEKKTEEIIRILFLRDYRALKAMKTK